MVRIEPGPTPVYARIGPGRWWRPGKVHRVAFLDLVGGTFGETIVGRAHTPCGTVIDYPNELTGLEPEEAERCRRCWK